MRFFFSHALVYRVSFEVDAQWELRDPCGEPAEPPGVQSISTALLVAVVASFVVLFACVPSIIAFLLIKHKKDRVSNTKLGRTSSNRSINEDTNARRLSRQASRGKVGGPTPPPSMADGDQTPSSKAEFTSNYGSAFPNAGRAGRSRGNSRATASRYPSSLPSASRAMNFGGSADRKDSTLTFNPIAAQGTTYSNNAFYPPREQGSGIYQNNEFPVSRAPSAGSYEVQRSRGQFTPPVSATTHSRGTANSSGTTYYRNNERRSRSTSRQRSAAASTTGMSRDTILRRGSIPMEIEY